MIAQFLKWIILIVLVGKVSCNTNKFSAISDVVHITDHLQLKIIYGDNVVDYGNELSPTQVKGPPQVLWNDTENYYHSLLMIDPDAPSRENPIASLWLHWSVGNIPNDEVAHGETIAEYVGPGPPKGTGHHRYIFLLYRQRSKLNFDEPYLKKTSGFGRSKFSLKLFQDKYSFQNPIASNFFIAQWDSYVPHLQKQLKGN